MHDQPMNHSDDIRTRIVRKNIYIYEVLIIIAILVLSLALRLQPSLQEHKRGGYGQFGDTFLYHDMAYNLYKGNGFSGTPDVKTYGIKDRKSPTRYEPTATRGPIYPLFMCMVYKMFDGHHRKNRWKFLWNKVRMLQGVLDALLCLVIYFFVRSVISSSSIPAIIASILYCFSFFNIYYSHALLSESVATFLISCFLWFAVMGLKYPGTNRWIIYGGAIMGGVCLTRPEYLLFVPMFALYVYYYFYKIKIHAFKKAMLFICAAFIIIFPWTIRNYMVFKKPIIVSVSGLGYSLFLGTIETKSGEETWVEIPEDTFNEKQQKIIDTLSEKYKKYFYNGSIKIKEVDDAFMAIALHRIKNAPFETFKIWMKRIPNLWYHNYTPYRLFEPPGMYFGFYCLFSICGMILITREKRKMIMPVVLLVFYITIIFLPLHVEPRYGAPLLPGIISITAIGLWQMMEKAHKWAVAKNQRHISSDNE